MTQTPPLPANDQSPVAPQAGIRNRPPEHAIVAALQLPTAPADAQAAIAAIRQIENQELASTLPLENASTPKAMPGPETGELGFADNFDRRHLTVTTGFSSSGFDKLGIAAANRPQDLIPIPWQQLGDSPAQPSSGDLILQICSDDPYVCEHLLHRVTYELAGKVTLVWAQVGVQRYTAREGRTSRSEGRALIGFIDGTANLDARDCHGIDDGLIFVDPANVGSYPPLPPPAPQPAYGQSVPAEFPSDLRPPPGNEPPWTKWGSYMVVRSALQNFDSWDGLTLGAQEQLIGRFKYSGAFLDLTDDPEQLTAAPAFASNPQDVAVPLTSHVRKANPRGVDDGQRRIFRRGYPLVVGNSNGLDRGLLFIAFGRSISTQFEFIFRAWMRNPNFPAPNTGQDALFAQESRVLCGGYYFVPPLTDTCDPTSWVLPNS